LIAHRDLKNLFKDTYVVIFHVLENLFTFMRVSIYCNKMPI